MCRPKNDGYRNRHPCLIREAKKNQKELIIELAMRSESTHQSSESYNAIENLFAARSKSNSSTAACKNYSSNLVLIQNLITFLECTLTINLKSDDKTV